jgi:site-specific DNA-methyltransferase (adenine-specific)
MKKLKRKVINIDMIRPYWRNPRNNDETIKHLVKSISDFGYIQRIAVDKENVIIVGHARYKALKELGFKEVEVIVLDLPERQAKQYRIADNKVAEKSTWDKDKLIEELEAIGEADFSFDYKEIISDMSVNFDKLSKVDIKEKCTEVECPYCDFKFKV